MPAKDQINDSEHPLSRRETSGVYEGTVVRERAVLAPGTVLTGGTVVFDLVHDRTYRREGERPLEIPSGAVVVPGSRPVRSGVVVAWPDFGPAAEPPAREGLVVGDQR